MGTNIGGIADWSTEWPFVDMFKSSRAWIVQYVFNDFSTWSIPNVTIPKGALDYPTSLPLPYAVGSIMSRDLNTHYENGTYTVLYDGDGVINFWLDDVKAVRRLDVGRMEVDVVPTTGFNNGVFLRVERSNPADPIRNVRVILPGFLDTFAKFPFHPLFLKNLEKYSTLRFMDFTNTNSQGDSTWASRITPPFRTYSINGVPVETAVLLANTLGADAWFCVPHLATDDYVQQLASTIFTSLRPDVKVAHPPPFPLTIQVYVEYSNEVWGTLFPGGQVAMQRGLSLNLSSNGDDARFCYLALRSSQIFDIFASVFGPANRSRLKFVVASQAVNPDVTRRILRCNDFNNRVDVVSLAPYLDVPLAHPNGTILSADDAFAALSARVDAIEGQVFGHLAVMAQFNLSAVNFYECGQGLVGANAAQNALAMSLNRDVRMTALYQKYFWMLRRTGAELAMHFSSVGKCSQWGCWGLLEAQDQDPAESPKV